MCETGPTSKFLCNLCVCVRALRIVSKDKILLFKNTLLLIILISQQLCETGPTSKFLCNGHFPWEVSCVRQGPPRSFCVMGISLGRSAVQDMAHQ